MARPSAGGHGKTDRDPFLMADTQDKNARNKSGVAAKVQAGLPKPGGAKRSLRSKVAAADTTALSSVGKIKIRKESKRGSDENTAVPNAGFPVAASLAPAEVSIDAAVIAEPKEATMQSEIEPVEAKPDESSLDEGADQSSDVAAEPAQQAQELAAEAAAAPADLAEDALEVAAASVEAAKDVDPAPVEAAAAATSVFQQPARQTYSSIKDILMDTNFNGMQDAMTEAQAKAQAAFEKSASMMGEASEFAKGNVEAMIASSKIMADGVQQIGSSMVAESRTAFEAMSGDMKELAAAKSPTDFFKIQSEMVRKNFDNAVAYGSKNSETMLKLMSDAMAPISSRVSLAVEKARQVVPMNTAPTSTAA